MMSIRFSEIRWGIEIVKKKIIIICLMLSTISLTLSPIVEAYSTTKTHTSTMAQLKKSSIFKKKTQTVEPIARPVSLTGQAVYANIAAIAPNFVGTPYVFGGKTPAGFDCSGFIHYVHQFAGLDILRMSSEDYFKLSSKVNVPEVGDLVFFKDTYKEGISHMGIYMGENTFVHAGSKGVEITKLDNPYWQLHFVAFKRFNVVTD